jgi:putative ABC transport system permease protein
MWTPLHFVGTGAPTNVIARLRPGVTVDAATREARLIVATAEPTPRNPAAAFGTTVMPVTMFFGQRMDKSGLRTALLVLFAAVGVVLLIACANVANLVLARAWGRQREFAIRAALGAGRGRLLRLVLAESLLLSLAGGALGMLVGWRALDVIVGTRPNFLSELSVVHVDRLVLTLSLALAAISGIAFGLPPAIFASGTRMSLALTSQSRSATGGAGPRRLRSGLVVTEVALSVVLLVAAGLLIRSMVALTHADTGIDPRGLTSVQLEFPREHFAAAAGRAAAEASILSEVRAMPGIRGASLALVSPPSSAFWAGGALEIDGQPQTASEKKPVFGINLVTPDYFTTVGLRLQRGHVFAPAPNDTNRLRPRDVVISETFARQHWPRGEVLGQRFRAAAGGPWMTVVGVVGDVRMPGKSDNVGHSQVYQPVPPGSGFVRLIVSSAEPLATLAPRLITAISVADRSVRVRRILTVESNLVDATAVPRFVTALLTAFAALALVLATVGLYGVIAVSVGQRIREIGVRVALGAQRRDVLSLVVGDGLRLTAAGLALGIGGSLLATRALRGLLVGVGLGDGATLAFVAALVVATAIIASYLPARRATRIDPVEALRAE